MKNNTSFPYAFFEEKVVPIEKAQVNIMTNALQYGTGIFGGIRCYISEDKKAAGIFRLSDHYHRFLKSLKVLDKPIKYSHADLIKITLDLARKNNPTVDAYIRPIAYAADYELSPDLSQSRFDFAAYMIPLGEYLPVSKGLKLMTSNWIRINDNQIPSRAKVTGGYINSSLARAEAVRHGYDDAIMLTIDGHISEGSAANFFIIRDGALITPSKNSDVLEGITRKTIIELAHNLSIPVEERPIDRTEIYVSDEAFLSGTGAQVAWVKEVDGREISPTVGPITQKIQHLFFSIVRGNEKKYSHWLTRI